MGELLIILTSLTCISVFISILLKKAKGNVANNILLTVICLTSLFLGWMNYTSLPKNYIWQRTGMFILMSASLIPAILRSFKVKIDVQAIKEIAIIILFINLIFAWI